MSNYKFKIGDVVKVYNIDEESCTGVETKCIGCIGHIKEILKEGEECPYYVNFDKEVCSEDYKSYGRASFNCNFNIKEIEKASQKEADKYWLEKYKYV